MNIKAKQKHPDGMTLIELLIVLAVMGILMATAIPGYRNYALRVNRSEAIRMLLQASMCQQRLIANSGQYDTSQCKPGSGQNRYQLSYEPPDSQGRTYLALAIPQDSQQADPCGSLSLDQNGAKGISNADMSITKCWNGR